MTLTFDHIAQAVPDIAAAVSWHRQLFPDLSVLYEDDTWAFVQAGGVRLAFVLRGQHPGHTSFRVAPNDLDRLARTFGREIKPHRDGSRSVYLDAPGGNCVEIIAYPAGDPYGDRDR